MYLGDPHQADDTLKLHDFSFPNPTKTPSNQAVILISLSTGCVIKILAKDSWISWSLWNRAALLTPLLVLKCILQNRQQLTWNRVTVHG